MNIAQIIKLPEAMGRLSNALDALVSRDPASGSAEEREGLLLIAIAATVAHNAWTYELQGKITNALVRDGI